MKGMNARAESTEEGMALIERLDELLLANTTEIISIAKEEVKRQEPQFSLLKQMHQAKVLRQALKAHVLNKKLSQVIYAQLTSKELEAVQQHRVINQILRQKLKHFLLERIFLLY